MSRAKRKSKITQEMRDAGYKGGPPRKIIKKELKPLIKYDASMGEYICREISKGRTVTDICKEPGVPDHVAIWEWRVKDAGFANKYARARQGAVEKHVDEVIELARNANGKSSSEIQKIRLLIDTIKWVACKVYPRVYGDRIEHTGTDGLVSAVINVTLGTQPKTIDITPEEDSGDEALVK